MNKQSTSHLFMIEPDSFYVIGSFIPATCNQTASASISTYGGTNPVTFLWSNGDTNSTASGFDGGDHWVIATDSCGNTSIYEFTVIEHILETSIYHTNNPDNYAEVEVINSTAGSPYTYQWYVYSNQNTSATPISGGNYYWLSLNPNIAPDTYFCLLYTSDAADE